MKTLARFRQPEDAHLFRSYLASGGIEAHVLDEHVVQLFWHYSDAIGGVRVVVADEDLPAAIRLRDEHDETLRSHPPTETVARVWPLVLAASIMVGIPCLIFGRKNLSTPNHSAN